MRSLIAVFLFQFGIVIANELEPFDLVVVGAGAGGAYAAWRAAAAGKSVCVLELAARPGGRIHSLRNQGPRKDLVVEAGAYRFAPHKVIEKINSNLSWVIDTPITAAIVKKLGLRSKAYDPDPTLWDHNMHKLTDAEGNDIGYLTLVETMLNKAVACGAKLHYGAMVVGLQTRYNNTVTVQLAGGGVLPPGDSVIAKSVVLNLPQGPLLQLLRQSTGDQFTSTYPRPLYIPASFPLMKMYVHYDDAWWRNYLNLTAGRFFNTEPRADPMSEQDRIPLQEPAPLLGQYHDGDFRCDGPEGRCRGFIQAYYGGDDGRNGSVAGGVKWYRVFANLISADSVTQITTVRPDHRDLLRMLHTALVNLHKGQLDAVNMTEHVNKTLPTSAVMSIWSEGVSPIQAGCHRPKNGTGIAPQHLPEAALQPFPGMPVFVANEAYGHMTCFAEGSLAMAEEVMARMGISREEWLNEALRQSHLARQPSPGHLPVWNDPSFLIPLRSREAPTFARATLVI